MPPSLPDELSTVLARPAHRLLPDLRDLLARFWGVEVICWLVDERQQALTAVDDPARSPEPIDGGALGRAFAGQQVLTHDRQGRPGVAVPVSVRGDRLGVLELLGDDGATLLDQVELEQLGHQLAQSIVASSIHSDVLTRSRRTRQMTLAAELQWNLLPGQAYADDAVSVGALLEPAYSVAGDCYDWARDEHRLQVVAMEGEGQGVRASLAVTLALTALRNARRSGLPLADQVALADQAVYAQLGGSGHVAALVLELDLQTGMATAVDAGSPQLHRIRGGVASQLHLEAQLPLGMFQETVYRAQPVDLVPGDRAVIVTDGLYAAPTASGLSYAEAVLANALNEARLLSAAEAVRLLLRRMEIGPAGPDDDVVAVCVDWQRPTG